MTAGTITQVLGNARREGRSPPAEIFCERRRLHLSKARVGLSAATIERAARQSTSEPAR